MIGGVKVDPATFKQAVVLNVQPRTDFDTKEHKHTKDGIPLWRVQCAVTDWQDRTDTLMVTIASPKNPSELVPQLTACRFDGLELGIMERDGRTTVWFTAAGLVPLQEGKP